MKPPLNYTTVVPVSRSAGACQAMLGEAGASAVAVTYANRKPVGLSFRLETAHGVRDFELPVNIEGVHHVLCHADYPSTVRPGVLGKYLSREHAEQVAWRIAKDWLEAQLAIIAAGMVTLDEVMLPYLQVEGGTLYQAYRRHETAIAALEAAP